MADGSDPKTWKDVRKFNATLGSLRKRLEAKGPGAGAEDPAAVAEEVVAVLHGHQKSLVDLSEVAGKLAVYTTATHERKRQEIAALAQLVKAVKRLTRDVDKLRRRVERLEGRAARKLA